MQTEIFVNKRSLEIAKLLAEKDTDAELKAIKLLHIENAEARQTAALILSLNWSFQ